MSSTLTSQEEFRTPDSVYSKKTFSILSALAMRDAEVTVPALLQRLPQQCSLPCREEASLVLSQMFPFIAQHEEVERSQKTALRKKKTPKSQSNKQPRIKRN
ncbi:hypothetical protein EK904_011188, partial [Melospiza melodia maxima]